MSDVSSQGPPEGTAPPADPAAAAAASAQAMLQQAQEPTTPSAPAPQQQEPAPQLQGPFDGSQPQEQQAPAPQEPVLSDFAQGVLKDIPEGEREIVAKYLGKWDAGVTRRFQEVQSTWSPLQAYLDQGVEVTDVENAIKLYMLLDEDPEAALNILAQATGIQLGSGPQQQVPQQPAPFQPQQQPPAPQSMQQAYAQLPPEIQQQLQQSQQFQQQFAQWWAGQQQEQHVAQQDAELDQYLTLLRQEKGDFDEKYVLALMGAGVDGATAVDQWRSSLQQFAPKLGYVEGQQQQAPPPPAVLNGGAAPVGAKPVAAASDTERKAAVAAMLNAANAQG